MKKEKVEQERKLRSANINEGYICKKGGEGSEGCQSMSYATKNIEVGGPGWLS